VPRWVLYIVFYVIGSLFPFNRLLGAIKGA
jgi:hypothetical protein